MSGRWNVSYSSALDIIREFRTIQIDFSIFLIESKKTK